MTTWSMPEYRMHPFLDQTNPLLLLLTGPLDWDDLVNFGLMYTSELREWELQNFLIDLEKQEDLYHHTRRWLGPLLIPKWWDKNPSEFLEDMNLSLRPWLPDKDMSLKDQEMLVWEILLTEWAIRNDREYIQELHDDRRG